MAKRQDFSGAFVDISPPKTGKKTSAARDPLGSFPTIKPAKRSFTGKKNKRGYRAFKGDATPEEIAYLFNQNPDFRQTVNMVAAAQFQAGDPPSGLIPFLRGRKFPDVDAQKIRDLISTPSNYNHRDVLGVVRLWATESNKSYSKWLEGGVASYAKICNLLSINPLDLKDWLRSGVFSYSNSDDSYSLSSALSQEKMAEFGRLIASHRAMRIKGFSLGSNSFNTILGILRQVYSQASLSMPVPGFMSLAGVKPLLKAGDKLPSDCIGFRVVEINYQIPTQFNEAGDPVAFREVSHPTANARALQLAYKVPGSQGWHTYEKILSQFSVAGELFLAFTPDGRKAFFTTTNKPKRSLWASDQSATNPDDAVIFDVPATGKFGGLIV